MVVQFSKDKNKPVKKNMNGNVFQIRDRILRQVPDRPIHEVEVSIRGYAVITKCDAESECIAEKREGYVGHQG